MIHFLVKVFSEKQHADSFVRGELYANRLSWFKNIESSDGRGDEYEGAVMPQRDNLVIKLTARNQETGEVDEITITPDELVAPPVLQLDRFNDLNLFCMYAAHSSDFEPQTDDPLQELKTHIEIPEDCLKLGRYAVAITDVGEFVRRVHAAASREGYEIARGYVEYYDPEIGTPLEPLSERAVFRKREEFAHQREYRFAIDTGTRGSEPVVLNIGDIDDITMLLDTAEINELFSFSPNPPD